MITKTPPRKLVNENMLLGEVVKKYPQAAEVMLQWGLHCVGCVLNPFDTIKNGAKIHKLSDREIAEMIEQINLALRDFD